MQYARTADGAHIAYQVVGESDHDLVLTLNTIPVDSVWEEPDLGDAFERLARSVRLVLFDRRGMGCSDALPHGRVLTQEELMIDATAVMDAAGSERAFVLKTDSAASAVLLATTFPHRVSGLVLFNSYARLARSDDYPMGLPVELVSTYLAAAQAYEMEQGLELMGRPRTGDDRFRRWFLKALRRSAPPGGMATLVSQDFQTDVRHILPLVQVPTLVVHNGGNPYIRPAHGRYLAERIPGAHYLELPGEGHSLAATDLAAFVDGVIEFVTGSPSPARIDRVLATVLFSDIVDSTRLAVELGDRRWRALLDQHDAVVNRQLVRFGGRLVKTTGDGVVATFDGPARALTCAVAVRDGLRRLDLDIRVGIHAGEVDVRGEDVSGISVNVAARVQSQAETGEILATRTVVDLVAGSGLRFGAAREVKLKGVPGSWVVFPVAST